MGSSCSCVNNNESKSNMNLNPERIKEISRKISIYVNNFSKLFQNQSKTNIFNCQNSSKNERIN